MSLGRLWDEVRKGWESILVRLVHCNRELIVFSRNISDRDLLEALLRVLPLDLVLDLENIFPANEEARPPLFFPVGDNDGHDDSLP